jgi:hypothetical protein
MLRLSGIVRHATGDHNRHREECKKHLNEAMVSDVQSELRRKGVGTFDKKLVSIVIIQLRPLH